MKITSIAIPALLISLMLSACGGGGGGGGDTSTQPADAQEHVALNSETVADNEPVQHYFVSRCEVCDQQATPDVITQAMSAAFHQGTTTASPANNEASQSAPAGNEASQSAPATLTPSDTNEQQIPVPPEPQPVQATPAIPASELMNGLAGFISNPALKDAMQTAGAVAKEIESARSQELKLENREQNAELASTVCLYEYRFFVVQALASGLAASNPQLMAEREKQANIQCSPEFMMSLPAEAILEVAKAPLDSDLTSPPAPARIHPEVFLKH